MENRDNIIALNHEGRKALKKSAFDLIYSNAGLFCASGFFYCVMIGFLRLANDELGQKSNLASGFSATTSIGGSLAQLFLIMIMMLIATAFVMGIYRAVKLEEKHDLSTDSTGHLLFGAFDNQNLTSTVSVSLLKFAYLLGWYMLLIVPGIIKKYAYALSSFVMADSIDRGHPLSATEALRKSEKLMKGHKFDFFILRLSLLGWYFLGIITLGVGMVFVHPFSTAITAKFYEALVKQDEDDAIANTTEDNLDLFDDNDDDLFADDNDDNEEKSDEIDISDALLDDNDFKDLDDLAKYQKEHEKTENLSNGSDSKDADHFDPAQDDNLFDSDTSNNFGLEDSALDDDPLIDADLSTTDPKPDKSEKTDKKSDKSVDNTDSKE